MKYVGLYDNDKDIVTKEKLDAAVPTKTSQLENDSGFITSAPVTSVNTKTGAVELTASDVGAQNKITASGILKGDGAGGVSTAVANTDYATCTNLRNGSAEGSLRTSGASAEDSTYTMGQNAFAEGSATTASEINAHAEGYNTEATGPASHAEGGGTIASGANSHAEGSATTASEVSAHSEGWGTIASGTYSHSEGYFTTANHKSQHVQGEYNITDESTAIVSRRGNYAHIVGNGTENDRSNAHTLDWSGNAWFAGNVYVGSTSGTHKDDGSKKLITADEVPTLSDTTPLALGTASAGTSTEASRADHVHPKNVIIVDAKNPLALGVMVEAIDDGNIILLQNDSDIYTLSYFNGTPSSGEEIELVFTSVSVDTSKNTYITQAYTVNGNADWTGPIKLADEMPSEVFIATYDTTTYAEIKAAYDAGKAVFCKYGVVHLVPLTEIRDSRLSFYSVVLVGTQTQFFRIYCNANDTWATSGTNLVPSLRRINGKYLTSDITLGHTYNTTLTSSGWTSSSGTLTQTLTVSGLVATYNAAPTIDLALDQVAAANKKSVADAWGKISGYMEANTAANSITFTVYADTAPTVNIPIRITTYD